jgi:hypothetical protein
MKLKKAETLAYNVKHFNGQILAVVSTSLAMPQLIT